MIQGKTLEEWIDLYPKIQALINYQETIWFNNQLKDTEESLAQASLSEADISDAEARLKRFAPYIVHVFPETKNQAGIIESPLIKLENTSKYLDDGIDGPLYLKADNLLPISGSIKARGGIYEVLSFAEKVALEAGILSVDDNYKKIDSEDFKTLFSKYELVCGSTGNLGLSIGIMASKLGFKVIIHMSQDARQWKKDLLRSKGVTVIEHEDDYSKAVYQGRLDSQKKRNSYFIDDENSKTLFLGYAVAAIRLKAQLQQNNIHINLDNPLNVYLPCGVGGGPGGIAFGLKVIFKNAVNCYFAEPTHSPCMFLGMMTGCHEGISIQELGLDNITAADGLAVGRPSGFVGKLLEHLIKGIYTVSDQNMFKLLSQIYDYEGIKLEPSALVGLLGPNKTTEKGIHIAWATGGNMVPDDIYKEYYNLGKTI